MAKIKQMDKRTIELTAKHVFKTLSLTDDEENELKEILERSERARKIVTGLNPRELIAMYGLMETFDVAASWRRIEKAFYRPKKLAKMRKIASIICIIFFFLIVGFLASK